MEELKYPVGMQSFPEIRERGFVFVDKSKYIDLLHRNGKYFFLSRPRRFGKSLFLSMLKTYYEGRKDLFEGLDVIESNHNWEPQPVLHLDFTGRDYTEPDSLNSRLRTILETWEKEYGCPMPEYKADERFERIIQKAFETTGKKVVILIDEYDKPLLDTVKDPALQDKFRNVLRGVYGNLKKMDSFIQFAMLTGVTRFGKLSIFSDLNNLKDISMMEEFSGICGVTTEELYHYFDSGVDKFAKSNDLTKEEAYQELKENYDGYHFSTFKAPDIYNPYSLLNALQDKMIGYYWFATGTPSFLVNLIKQRQLKLQSLDELKEAIDTVTSISFDLKSTLAPVLYQSGYLTIKGYNTKTKILTLGFPNNEVRRGFLLLLMGVYTETSAAKSWTDIVNFYDDISSGRIEDFMQRLQSLYADFNIDGFKFLNLEQHYQDVAYLVFRLLGCLTSVEYKTSSGRIDLVVTSPDYIYVFEFKRNGSPEEALLQIDGKEYMIPFAMDGRKLVKIGANFCDATKGLDSWIIEMMPD